MSNDKPEKQLEAVALRYDMKTGQAPKVTAKGSGFVAEQIIKVAQKNAVPIYQNKTLASVLLAVDLDREIPEDLYKAVAEVLAYVYRLDQKTGSKDKKK